MVGLKKRGVITAVAGILAAVTITGCSAAPDNDATLVTVGTEKVSYGVAQFYARMQQAQYESFYAGLMGMSVDTMWSQEVEEGKTYEENMKVDRRRKEEDRQSRRGVCGRQHIGGQRSCVRI